jgi:hypothetical protein
MYLDCDFTSYIDSTVHTRGAYFSNNYENGGLFEQFCMGLIRARGGAYLSNNYANGAYFGNYPLASNQQKPEKAAE